MRALFLIAMVLCAIAQARADGGRLQVRETAGPFAISLFTAPEVLAVGPADISVMVEEPASGRVLLDADIVITLTLADDQSIAPLVAHLSHSHATNRMLEDAVIDLPRAGRWHAALQVREGGRDAHARTDLTVANRSSRRGTVWLFAALPLLGLGLFVWAQAEKRARRARALHPA